jgi:hypothetical protein
LAVPEKQGCGRSRLSFIWAIKLIYFFQVDILM